VIGFTEFPRLETERLVLRMMTSDDAEFYFMHFSDPGIVSTQAHEGPKDMDAAIAELQEYCIDNFTNDIGVQWGIALKRSPELIGTCGFYKWVKHAHHAEIGCDLDSGHRHDGIMTEALTAVLDFLFTKVGLNRVQALVDPSNVPSIKLLDRLGFTKEGVLRDHTCFRNAYLDEVVYSILRREWERRKA